MVINIDRETTKQKLLIKLLMSEQSTLKPQRNIARTQHKLKKKRFNFSKQTK